MTKPLQFDEATRIAITIHEAATVVVGILEREDLDRERKDALEQLRDDLCVAQARIAEIHDDPFEQ